MFFFLQAESIRLLHKQCQLSGDIISIAHRDADPSTGKGFVWVFASRWMLQRLLERGHCQTIMMDGTACTNNLGVSP
jgi:hypothetical protein